MVTHKETLKYHSDLKWFLHKYARKVDLAIGQTHFKRKIHRRQVITQYTNIGQGRAFKSQYTFVKA